MENTENHNFVHFLPFPSLPEPQKGIEFLRFYMTWDTWLNGFMISYDSHENRKNLNFPWNQWEYHRIHKKSMIP